MDSIHGRRSSSIQPPPPDSPSPAAAGLGAAAVGAPSGSAHSPSSQSPRPSQSPLESFNAQVVAPESRGADSGREINLEDRKRELSPEESSQDSGCFPLKFKLPFSFKKLKDSKSPSSESECFCTLVTPEKLKDSKSPSSESQDFQEDPPQVFIHHPAAYKALKAFERLPTDVINLVLNYSQDSHESPEESLEIFRKLLKIQNYRKRALGTALYKQTLEIVPNKIPQFLAKLNEKTPKGFIGTTARANLRQIINEFDATYIYPLNSTKTASLSESLKSFNITKKDLINILKKDVISMGDNNKARELITRLAETTKAIATYATQMSKTPPPPT